MEQSKLLENLNAEQKQAVTHGGGPLLIVAGAGTGKTTVITRKIAYLIEKNLAQADEILALTFTDKAAGEMQERVDLLLPLGYFDMWISTFHSFCQRILEQHGLDIGLPGDFKLLNETRAWILVHNNLDKFNLDYYRPLGNPKKFINALLKHFSRCKDELISPADYLKYAEELRLATDQPSVNLSHHGKAVAPSPGIGEGKGGEISPSEISRLEEIANAYHVYQKLLLDNNYLDFGDLINYTLDLFQKRPKILQFYQNKFKYTLVDEFQDTNYAQYQLVKLLAGTRQNLAVVGDDDQSIYKFRGASVSNILKFQDDFPDLTQITLTKNYRSGQKILDLAYNFIQANNPDRLEEKLKIDKKLYSKIGSGLKTTPTEGIIEVLEGKDLSAELNSVAEKILELKSADLNSTWNDFAVLLRSNAAAQELLPVLAQHGIPHTFVANTGLYQKPLIADLLAYLEVLDNFHDSFALYRVLSFAPFRLPEADIATLLFASGKKTLSLYEILDAAKSLAGIGAPSQAIIEKILANLRRHAQLAQTKAANEAFVAIIHDLDIAKALGTDSLENAENSELLEQFYKKIETFTGENANKSLHYFLHHLRLEQEAGDEGQIKFDPNLGPESLKVLTVHAAKGLEFSYVLIPNLVEQRFPTRARSEQIAIPIPLIKDILPEGDFHLQEERRLFYVALTRAKTGLYLSWGKDYGGAKTKRPSVFLQETKLVPGPHTSQATGKVIFTPPTKNLRANVVLPASFSFSGLKAFQNCPLQYKYQYYLKLPGPGSSYFSFGQTMHKVFELYLKDFRLRQTNSQQDLFRQGDKQARLGDFKFLEDLFEKNWIDEWYDSKKQKEQYRLKGKQLLKIFFDYSATHPPRPKYLEQFFSLPLAGYKFVGKIDRADGGDRGLEIIDYKTSETIPTKNDKDDLDQLHVYQWAAQEHLHEDVSSLNYWYLQDNKFLPEPTASPAEIAALKQKLTLTIDQIIATIKSDSFSQAHAQVRDHRCQYQNFL